MKLFLALAVAMTPSAIVIGTGFDLGDWQFWAAPFAMIWGGIGTALAWEYLA